MDIAALNFRRPAKETSPHISQQFQLTILSFSAMLNLHYHRRREDSTENVQDIFGNYTLWNCHVVQ